jgi:hypothetical protein
MKGNVKMSRGRGSGSGLHGDTGGGIAGYRIRNKRVGKGPSIGPAMRLFLLLLSVSLLVWLIYTYTRSENGIGVKTVINSITENARIETKAFPQQVTGEIEKL